MTQDELDAIPETDFSGALWREEDDPCAVRDQQDVLWDIGRIDGKLVKRYSASQL